MRNLFSCCALIIVLLSSARLQASSAGKGHPPSSNTSTAPAVTATATPTADLINQPLSQSALKAPIKAIFQRVVQARLFHNGIWTLEPAQTPVTVGRTIASLRPSFVTGILRVPDRGELSNGEVECFKSVRSAVLASAKGARFDVVINAGVEQSAELFVRRMKEITARIHPDAWTLFVPPDDVTVNPDLFEAAIAQAHASGEMVGYDGPLSLIPEGADFIIVRAWDLKVNRKQIDLLRAKQRVPIIVELPTTIGSQSTPDVISYAEEMDTPARGELLARLAENQSAWGYRLAYPIFYPLCPAREAFDATKDNILLVTIRSLLTRFN